MSRRHGNKKKHTILSDAKYNDRDIAKLINYVMKQGKKSIASKIVYTSIESAAKTSGLSPLDCFHKIKNAIVILYQLSRHNVGGISTQSALAVSEDRGYFLSMKNVINNARSRKELSMVARLTAEFIDILANKGVSINRRHDLEKNIKSMSIKTHRA